MKITNKKNELLLGKTGTGKTFTAFKKIRDKDFIAVFPCRQLAYEAYIDYGRELGASLHTGEVHLEGNPKKVIAVFESAYNLSLSNFNVLFVDEAHFINDEDRGYDLRTQLVLKFLKTKKQVIFATATDSITDTWLENKKFKKVILKPFQKIPKKEEINSDTFVENIQKGMKSIYFLKYRPSIFDIRRLVEQFDIQEGTYGVIDANMPSTKRLKTQLDFASGKLQVVFTTNVLAQGLNFPAQQVYVEYNQWDTPEIIQQKIGRIGRPNKMVGDEAYYCVRFVKEVKKRKLPKKRKDNFTKRKYLSKETNKKLRETQIFKNFEVPTQFLSYSNIKYCLPFLKRHVNDIIDGEKREQAQYWLSYLLEEEKKLIQMLM